MGHGLKPQMKKRHQVGTNYFIVKFWVLWGCKCVFPLKLGCQQVETETLRSKVCDLIYCITREQLDIRIFAKCFHWIHWIYWQKSFNLKGLLCLNPLPLVWETKMLPPWTKFMLQWFIRFAGFTDFPFHSEHNMTQAIQKVRCWKWADITTYFIQIAIWICLFVVPLHHGTGSRHPR